MPPATVSCGILLYAGTTVVPFGKNLLALPMPGLWDAFGD